LGFSERLDGDSAGWGIDARALGRSPSFLVEDIGDLGAIEALSAKLGGTHRERSIALLPLIS